MNALADRQEEAGRMRNGTAVATSSQVVDRARSRLRGLTAILIIVAPLDVAAQSEGSCEAALRTGIRPAYPHAVEDGSPIADMRTGATLAIDLACDVDRRLRAGFDVEANMGSKLTLLHFLAVADRALLFSRDSGWSIWFRGGAGWAVTAGGVFGSSPLVAAGSGRAIQQGTSGLALGAGGRAEAALSSRVRLIIDGSWRGALVEETDFDRDDEKRRTLVHVFPITVGLGLRL